MINIVCIVAFRVVDVLVSKNTRYTRIKERKSNIDTKMVCNIAFFGNPGAGKSTLLNCLIDMKHGKGKGSFKSGVNIAKGLTYKFEQTKIGNYVYMDTPGLDDVVMRKQAAKGISDALKQGGTYIIVFVVRESSGKIFPSDLATINTVLKSAPEIKTYGLIINKLSKPVYNKFSKPENKSYLQSVFEDNGKNKKVTMLFLRNIEDLEDVDNETVEIPTLKKFIDSLPKNAIHGNNVGDVDKHLRNLESQIETLRLEQEKKLRELKEHKREAERKRRREKERQERERRYLEQEATRRREEQARWQQEQLRSQQEEARRQAERRQAEFERIQQEERERQAEIQRQHEENIRRQKEEQARKEREHEEWLRRERLRHSSNDECCIL